MTPPKIPPQKGGDFLTLPFVGKGARGDGVKNYTNGPMEKKPGHLRDKYLGVAR